MGKIRRGILGGFSGKVANIIGGSWKGIAYMRSQPLSVANPNTPGQQAQRGAFGHAVAMASALLANYIKPLWDRWAEQMSGYNAWIQANISNFNLSGVVDYASFIMSRGSLGGANSVNALEGANPTDVDITYSNDSGAGNRSASDIVYCVAINQTTGEVITQTATKTRTDGTISAQFKDTTQSGDMIHTYISFLKADGTIVSDSQYSFYAVI